MYKITGNKKKADKVLFIRYADDFVIFSPEKEWLEIAIETIQSHIAQMGLKIKSKKTRTLRTVPVTNDKDDKHLCSFNFLGFTFSQRKVSRYKKVKLGAGKRPTDLVPVVLPMKTKITNYFSRVSIVFKKSQSALQLIQNLNPLLRGWRNYYKFSDARTYGSLPGLWDSRINIKCRHWIKRNCNRYGRNPIF